jgi:hypothetical protein
MAANDPPWRAIEKDLVALPWFVERHLAAFRATLTPARAKETLADLRFLLDWMVKARVSKAAGPADVSFWEVVQLSSSDMARYQAVLAGAARYRDRKEMLRHLQTLKAFLGDLGGQVAGRGSPEGARPEAPSSGLSGPASTAPLVDRREPANALAVTLVPRDEPVLVVTAAHPDEDLFPRLSERQVVAGPFLENTLDATGAIQTLKTPEGAWELSWLRGRLPEDFASAALLVQVDAALRHRPVGLAGYAGRRVFVAEAASPLGRLDDEAVAEYLAEEPFDGVVAVSSRSLSAVEPSGLPARQVAGLLARYENTTLGAKVKTEAVVLVPTVDEAAIGEGAELAAELAEGLNGTGLRVNVHRGSVVTCLAASRGNLLSVHPLTTDPESVVVSALLGAGSLPFVRGRGEEGATAVPRRFESAEQLAVAIREALADGPGALAGVREALERWHRRCGLPATRRTLWEFVGSLSPRSVVARPDEPGAEPDDRPDGSTAGVRARRAEDTPDRPKRDRPFPASHLDPAWLDSPLPAGGRTLKLYIDSTSLSVIHQMADFVRCERDPDVYKIITWRRCVLEPSDLAQSRTLYYRQNAGVSPEFIATVAQVVDRVRPTRVEVHSNQRWSLHGVLPVLRLLFASGRLRPEQVDLRLYDDGLWSLQERDALKANPSLHALLELGAVGLARLLFSDSQQSIHNWMTHGWHRVLRTRYIGLHLDRFFGHVERRYPLDSYERAHETMRFAYQAALSGDAWERFLHLYGVDDALKARLLALKSEPDAFLYLGTGSVDPEHNATYAALQVTSIARFQQMGLLPTGRRIGFKGHPANPDNEPEVIAALGGNVVHVPARVPLEVLEMADLLPAQIGGTVSTSYLTMQPERVRFVFGSPLPSGNVPSEDTSRFLVECGIVTPEQVFPWLA